MRVIDLFAGAGGSSEGARQAGAHVVWAANHWPLAVEVHQRNHPETEHVCQDLHQFDWSLAPICDLVLASPACQGHSRAASAGGTGRRGSAPKHDSDRSTAWAVVSCLEATRAPVAVIENVAEFRSWLLYPSWCDALHRLGYTLTEHTIDSSWSGVPQRRQRLFITAARGPRGFLLALPVEMPVESYSIIDHTADRLAPWRAVSELPAGARSRIERAAARMPDARRFSVAYTSDDVGCSLVDPLSTITTKHQRAWVRRDGIAPNNNLARRMFTSREYARAMGFPETYKLTGSVSHDCKLLGNAVCPPVMRAIVGEVMRRA